MVAAAIAAVLAATDTETASVRITAAAATTIRTGTVQKLVMAPVSAPCTNFAYLPSTPLV